MFHCHIEWHLATGLAVTFIEAPLQLQKSLTIPQNHKDVCHAAGVPIAGNAAGNAENFLDLSGQNLEVHPLPAGFTTKELSPWSSAVCLQRLVSSPLPGTCIYTPDPSALDVCR